MCCLEALKYLHTYVISLGLFYCWDVEAFFQPVQGLPFEIFWGLIKPSVYQHEKLLIGFGALEDLQENRSSGKAEVQIKLCYSCS